MNLGRSRILSLVVLAVGYARAWSIPSGRWFVTLTLLPLLALIWFPEQIDDLTFGSWVKGYRIDTHTPGGLIAALGWALLLGCVTVLFFLPVSQLPSTH